MYHGRWLDPTDPRVDTADGFVDGGERDGVVVVPVFLVVAVVIVARRGCHDDRPTG